MNKRVTNITKKTIQLVNLTINSMETIILTPKDLTLAVENKIKTLKNLGFIKVFDVEEVIIPEVVVEEPQQEIVVEQDVKPEVEEEIVKEPKQDKPKPKQSSRKKTTSKTKKQKEEK